MDKLKKNLHLIVFGAGLLLGVVFLFVGMNTRAGVEEDMRKRVGSLKGASHIQTKADVDALGHARQEFDRSLEQSISGLTRGRGIALSSRVRTMDAWRQFEGEVVRPSVAGLRTRFEALRKETAMPPELAHLEVEPPPPGQRTVWDEVIAGLGSDLDPQRQVGAHMKLIILDEFCTACEKLLESARFQGGVRLVSVRFEELSVGGQRDNEAAWQILPFTIEIDCMPDFGIALMNELISPTNLTTGATSAGRERLLFPISLVAVQAAMDRRPLQAAMTIANEDRARWEIRADLDPRTPQAQEALTRIENRLQSEVKLALPVRFAMQMNAKRFNPNWRVLAAREGN